MDPQVGAGGAPAGVLPNILVPLDGSPTAEQVLPYVVAAAKSMGSQVALVRVLETDLLPTILDGPQQMELDRVIATAGQRALEYLQEAQARLRERGVAATTDVVPGSSAEGIVFLAHSLGADLIAMCTHGRSGLGRLLWGSVAEKVLQTAECPLLLVRARAEEEAPEGFESLSQLHAGAAARISRVVIGLDGSGLAERALPVAEVFAGALEVPLHLARIVPTAALALAGWEPGGSALLAADLATAMEEEAGGYLAAQAAVLRARGRTVETHVLRGEPASQLQALAAAEPGTLVVVATHGRTGPGRYIMGSVADRLVRGAVGPVVVVR